MTADLPQLSADVEAATAGDALQTMLEHWTADAAAIIGGATFEVRVLHDGELEQPQVEP